MSTLSDLSEKLARRLHRFTSHQFAQDKAALPEGRFISFCFDDFPQSAVRNALPLLQKRNWKATWYACGSYMGTVHPTYGPMFTEYDLRTLIRKGHDIGCHTYDHIDCANADSATLLAQSVRNARFLSRFGVTQVESFAFPFGSVDLPAKQTLSGVAPALRGVYPGLNQGEIDLHMLRACGIQADLGGTSAVYAHLEALKKAAGWLIIFTHDIAKTPSPWGCDPEAFTRLLDDVSEMDAQVVSVGDMVRQLKTVPEMSSALMA